MCSGFGALIQVEPGDVAGGGVNGWREIRAALRPSPTKKKKGKREQGVGDGPRGYHSACPTWGPCHQPLQCATVTPIWSAWSSIEETGAAPKTWVCRGLNLGRGTDIVFGAGGGPPPEERRS